MDGSAPTEARTGPPAGPPADARPNTPAASVAGGTVGAMTATPGAVPAQDGNAAASRPPTAAWPRISDYWPDKPEEPGTPGEPGPAGESPPGGEPAEPRLITAPPPRRHRLRLAVGAVTAVIFLGVSGVVLTRLVTDPEPAPPAAQAPQDQTGNAGPLPGSAAPEPAVPEPSPPVSVEPSPTVTEPPPVSPPAAALPFQAGTFDLVSNVGELNVTLGRPTDGVVDVRTAKGSGITARATVDGSTVRLKAEPNGRTGPARVDVVLDTRIAWRLKMSGGVSKATFGLAGGTVRGVDLSGGAATIDLALPRQSDGIPIRMSGGVRTWRIRTEKEVPVRVEVRRGAGEVVLYGDRERGVDRGETVRTGGDGAGRLEIEAVAGMGSLTVTSW